MRTRQVPSPMRVLAERRTASHSFLAPAARVKRAPSDPARVAQSSFGWLFALVWLAGLRYAMLRSDIGDRDAGLDRNDCGRHHRRCCRWRYPLQIASLAAITAGAAHQISRRRWDRTMLAV